MSKRNEGRDEPILEPAMPIVDAHHHLLDQPGSRYLIDDYLKDARSGHRIVASVYVETKAFQLETGPEMLRPLGEVVYANDVAERGARGGFGAIRPAVAIVGHADLRFGARIDELLTRAKQAAPDRFRGVRQTVMAHPSEAPWKYIMSGRPPSDAYQHPHFREGFARLAAHDLSFDAAGFHLQLPDIVALADAFPTTIIVLDNMTIAMGLEMDEDQRRALLGQWRTAVQDAARRPNIRCKVSGLGIPMWGFGFETWQTPVGYEDLVPVWRPYVEAAIEAFGTARCMFASDYPPDGASCGFVPLWNALKAIVATWSPDEKADLFHRTAIATYSIDPAVVALTPPRAGSS